MSEKIPHVVEYTLDELKEMVQPSTYEWVNVFDGKPVHQIFDEKPLLPGELFRPYPNTTRIHYEVSNFGRVKHDGKVLKQEEEKKGYLTVKSYLAYRFVAETWCNPPADMTGWEVHHITNNGYDNRPSNLLWVTAEQHKQIHQYF